MLSSIINWITTILYNIDTIYHLNCRSIQHTLIYLFIIIEDVTHPSRYTAFKCRSLINTWAIVKGGDVVPLSISNLFDTDAGFIILVWTPIF
jgi:hypothetical protein